MIVSLIGYMASGKSAIGRELARLYDFNFVDLDAYIESREGISISEIFELKGEIYFRKIEGEYLRYLLENSDRIVLSHGGGTPCYGKNMDLILKHSKTVYLKASINTLVERLQNGKTKRPLVAGLEDEKLAEYIAKHLFERRNFYEQAHYTVNVDNGDIKAVVKQIEALL